MGFGALVDALMKKPRVVFERPKLNSAELSVTPLFVRRGGAVQVAIAF
jgi:hypothetical protein